MHLAGVLDMQAYYQDDALKICVLVVHEVVSMTSLASNLTCHALCCNFRTIAAKLAGHDRKSSMRSPNVRRCWQWMLWSMGAALSEQLAAADQA